MPKDSSVSPETPAPVTVGGASEVTHSLLIARRLNRAGAWSAVPIALFCGAALALRVPQPSQQTLNEAKAVAAMRAAAIKQGAPQLAVAGVLSAEETMVATLRPAGSYATLRGELQPAIQVRGEAPIGGRVTEVLVRPGQKVNVGDPVLRVEGKVNAPGSKTAIKKQSAAEAAQVAAARRQEDLQKKMLAREEKLKNAQERVNAAKQRVALAREVVQRLARGESVTSHDVATLTTPQLATRLASRGSRLNRADSQLEMRRREAESALRQAKKEAEQASNAAETAKREAEQATKLAQTKKSAVKDAQTQLAKAEEQLNKGAIKTSEVETARGTLTSAQNAAHEASDKAEAAQKTATVRLADADKARDEAQAAEKALAQLPEVTEPTPAPATTLGAEEATQLAQAALDESSAAVAEAERLKREIDSYARQVKTVHQQLSSTGENLEAAQMEVVESKIAEKLEAVRAPASGVVLDVAAATSEVAPGETIIAIGRPDQLEIRFSDTSGVWKTLKTGTALPAAVQDGASNTPVLATLREIEAPQQAGESATLVTIIENPWREDGSARRFKTGLKVTCAIPRPGGAREALSVPAAALLRDEKGQSIVAVLSPMSEPASGFFRVEWRAVTPGQGNDLIREIAGGLKPGERIALRPQSLRQLTQNHGEGAVVKLSA